MLRMQKRDAQTAPKLGDRVPYVMVRGERGQEQYDKAEDPSYAIQNALPIDYRWYLENQLRKPVAEMLEPVIGTERFQAIMNEARRHLDAGSVPVPVPKTRIVGVGTKRAHIELVYDDDDDDDTNKLSAAVTASSSSSSSSSSSRSSILRYAQVLRTCTSCRTVIGGDANVEFCKQCEPHREQLIESAQKRVRTAQHNVDVAWEICRDCQGENFGHVECGNNSCHNFYQRQHVLQDLSVAIEELPPSIRRHNKKRALDAENDATTAIAPSSAAIGATTAAAAAAAMTD
jgi:DNA polymerase delta subunit 1